MLFVDRKPLLYLWRPFYRYAYAPFYRHVFAPIVWPFLGRVRAFMLKDLAADIAALQNSTLQSQANVERLRSDVETVQSTQSALEATLREMRGGSAAMKTGLHEALSESRAVRIESGWQWEYIERVLLANLGADAHPVHLDLLADIRSLAVQNQTLLDRLRSLSEQASLLTAEMDRLGVDAEQRWADLERILLPEPLPASKAGVGPADESPEASPEDLSR